MKNVMKFAVLVLALACSTAIVRADELTVADGANNSNYAPINGAYADENGNRNQMIYSADLLENMDGMNITAIKFYAGEASIDFGATYTVRLAETEATQLTGFVSATFTDVYSGTLNIVSNEVAFTFSENYTYGGGNLLLEIEQLTTTGAYGFPKFVGTASTKATYGNKVSYGSAGSLNFLAKTTFTYESAGAVTCPKPSALTAGTITSKSATFSWTAGGTETQWQYICVAAGGVADWEKASLTNTASVTLSNLAANTPYVLYVRAYCKADDQSKQISAAFTTPCGEISSLPWEYDFEDATDEKMPACWTKISTSSYPYAYNYSYYAHSGSQYMRFYGGNKEMMAVLPPFEEAINKLSISFYYTASKNTSYTTYATPQVGYLTNVEDASTFVALASLEQGDDDYQYFEAALSAAPAEAAYIALRYYTSGASAYGSFALDDISVFLTPSCVKPAKINEATEVTANSAKLTWEAGKSETQWQYVYAKTGSEVDWASATKVDKKEAALSGLSSDTEYVFYVRAYCADDDQSEAVSATFKTEPSCIKPASAEVSEITANSATLTWTASGHGETQYQYVVAVQGATPDWSKATLTESGTLSVTLSGLNPATNYDVYVRSYCAADDQSEAVGKSFKTACGAISTLPWSEDFENATAYALPDCWSRTDASYPQTYSWYAYKGSKCLYFWGGTNAIVGSLPEFAEPISGLSISFYYSNSTDYQEYTADKYPTPEVGYVTDPSDASTFVALQVLDKASTYQLVELNLKSVPATATNIAFRYSGGTASGILLIDNVVVTKTAACANPKNLVQTAQTYNSGSFAWEQGEDEEIYQYAVVAKGEAVSDWTKTETNVRTASVSGLTTGTEYEFVLRSWCSEGAQGDEIRLGFTPVCEAPTGLAVQAVSNESVTISWDANGATAWTIKCDGRTINADANVWTVDGLDAFTPYSVQVAVAAPCTSEYCAAVEFTTLCDAIGVPYNEDFEAATTGSLPDCWTKLTTGEYPQVASGGAAYGEEGKCLAFFGQTVQIVALPEFSAAVKDLTLSLYYKSNNSSVIYVGYIEEGDNEFIALGEALPYAESYGENAYAIDLKDVSADAQFIAIKYDGSVAGSGFATGHIDNVSVQLTKDIPSGIDDVRNVEQTTKRIEDGQLIIIRDGVRYNAIGTMIK